MWGPCPRLVPGLASHRPRASFPLQSLVQKLGALRAAPGDRVPAGLRSSSEAPGRRSCDVSGSRAEATACPGSEPRCTVQTAWRRRDTLCLEQVFSSAPGGPGDLTERSASVPRQEGRGGHRPRARRRTSQEEKLTPGPVARTRPRPHPSSRAQHLDTGRCALSVGVGRGWKHGLVGGRSCFRGKGRANELGEAGSASS